MPETPSLLKYLDRKLLHGAERAFGKRDSWRWWQDYRTGYPERSGPKTLLRFVAFTQIVVAVALFPVAALWYGLHEMPGFVRGSIRPAVKTLRHGQIGPYRRSGIVW